MDQHQLLLSSGEASGEEEVSCSRICLSTAEKINRCITGLRPSVDGEMRLLHNDHPADPLRAESMEVGLKDMSTRGEGRALHKRFNALNII